MDYIFDLNTLETTGIIGCPYCGRSKAYVYNNATGKLSSVCNICDRIVRWDFDNKTAYKSREKKYGQCVNIRTFVEDNAGLKNGSAL